MDASGIEQKPAWKSGWSVDKPLEFSFNWSPAAMGVWQPHGDHGATKRDLGLYGASAGLMRATHYKINGAGAHEYTGRRAHDLDVYILYVLAGSMTLTDLRTQEVYHFEAGGTATLPAFLPHKLEAFSDDLEFLEIVGPGDFETYTGDNMPPRAAAYQDASGSYSIVGPESFVDAAGPRTYFRYRDIGTSEPTDGRIYIHAVAMVPPCRVGGTGWHNHTMRQWIFILGGTADIDIMIDGEMRKIPVAHGDSMTLAAGLVHDVPNYTEDYFVLEMCIPKEYETAAIDRKTGV